MHRVLLLASLGIVLAGCGGSADTDTLGTSGTVGATVSASGAEESLRQIGTEAQAVVATQLQALATSTDDSEVRDSLGEARDELESLADRAENVETDDQDLASARDALHDALLSAADQAGQAQGSVDDGDIQGAVQDLLSSPAFADLEQAIQDIDAQSG